MKKRQLLMGLFALLLIAAPLAVGGNRIVEDISFEGARALIDENLGEEEFVILDVRTPAEYEAGRIEGSKNLDYYGDDFKKILEGLDRDRTYLVYCRSGNRSGRTLKLMRQLGFRRVYNLIGGIIEWEKNGLPLM